MTLSETGGAIASVSNKQKLNTHSSTEAELVASENFLLKILRTGRFSGRVNSWYNKVTISLPHCFRIINPVLFSKKG